MNIGSALSGFRLRGFNHNVQSFFMYGVLINAGMALFSLLFNLYLLRLSYQEDFIGLVASMAPLATGLLALPVGMLSDRFGRKPFLVASGLLLAISQLGACLMTSPTALLAFSFIGGIATSFIWVNHVPFLSDNAHSSRRAEALVIWSALQVAIRMLLSLAGGFMPGVMAYFIGASTEMPEPFRYSLLLGALCSIVSIFPLLRIPGHQSGHQRATSTANDHAAPDAAEPIPWRVFTGIATLSGTRGFSMGLTYPFINVFFEEELHVGPAMIGTIFFFSQLVGLPATFSAPALVRRFGATLTILPTRIIGGCALALMGTFINLPVAISMFLLSRMAEVIDNPSDQHFSTQILPRRYWARIQGFRVCGFQILNFAGSLLGGMLILDYGYWAAFGLACVSRVASGFIMAAFFGFRPVEQSDAPD
ncbi:MAG: MFS transporter [Gemmatimonadetes bacterium]|jgi:MFS family permease|nr:MFS transporter [Gemmatimonadota bacterium]MBT5328308.1 MFS transporter [Gemmatimonadota bacterium]MBT5451068.1 MFS transporter [Gemmatimonadota bacterium]MBT5801999.1 MFS transporter [Gemmatimonadota bacterium]MBT7421715.1 MFS transporter [Gemmatimonadota bacterium]|tara:strand:- start:1639 stop:2901 length:1263 start_codon:yes stop_codon:yes gene_type:complete